MDPRSERKEEACIETLDNTTSPWTAVYHTLPTAGEPTRAAHANGTGTGTERQAQSTSQPDSEAVYPSPDALSATL